MARPAREQQAGQARGRGQDEALDDLETDQPVAARAEGRADDQVALPRERARDHQVGHVGARDEEYERDHREEHRGEGGQDL